MAGLAVLGILLSAAGMIVAVAVGAPALGLNIYGRNPLAFTLAGLTFAAKLYVPGAAMLWLACNWMRKHRQLRNDQMALVGVMILVVCVPMALRGYWVGIGLLLVVVVGIGVPIVLGLRPWHGGLDAATRAN